MAEGRRLLPSGQLDIGQMLLEAQHRWLRPAEICEILRNYDKFCIAVEPPNMPPSGSLFLFDRKVLRYFRKDGHNWRKKKDGRTVKEAHERLKAGNIDVLHCYYAHGEENENFQRRSYWMLEEKLSHIVLVHYRQVKGNRKNFNRLKEAEDTIPHSHGTEEIISNTETQNFHPKNGCVPSQTTDLSTLKATEYEDAESEDHPRKFSTTSVLELVLTQPSKSKNDKAAAIAYELQKNHGFSSWKVSKNSAFPAESVPYQPLFSAEKNDTAGILFNSSSDKGQDYEYQPQVREGLQASEGSCFSQWPAEHKFHSDALYCVTSKCCDQGISGIDLLNSLEDHTHPDEPNGNSGQNEPRLQLVSGENIHVFDSESERSFNIEGKPVYLSVKGDHLFEGSFTEHCLKKVDSFNRWLSKDVGDVDESHLQSSSGSFWDMVVSGNKVDVSSIPSDGQLDALTLDPSISQDKLFSIVDFSPSWAYVGSRIKVLITGKFLTSLQEAEKCKWSCMFGEVEVPAELIADGVLRCHTPIHEAGRVPFYVTCSNRSACSEVREFEFQVGHVQDSDTEFHDGSSVLERLHTRFGRLLCLSPSSPNPNINSNDDVSRLSTKLDSLLKEDIEEWDQMLKVCPEELPLEKSRDLLLQKLLKQKLRVWLLQKVSEGGKGPNVLDEGGQGVLHFAAALGYNWALEPTIVAGVNVNFRDMNGWTALHWAASYGREHTVALLVALGAAPGVLTDPMPKYPLGQTPADLASLSGHKGIAGYLAESSLSAHLSSLTLDKQEAEVGVKEVENISDTSATLLSHGDAADGLSLKESLAAVCNAAQAAARIYQVFRVHSFQKKLLREYRDDKFGVSEEHALSLITIKSSKPGDEPVHAAAIRIQNKFRGWKGRKEFLILRQRIVKIQAHVRGYQVRKSQKKITWCVGILEKAILRWRRKGSGLRGFKPEGLTDMPCAPSNEDDYDFLKEGRKQAEERLQKALTRVKSMVQYPEGREQYRRLLKVVSEIQETKVCYAEVVEGTEATIDIDEDLIDIEALLDDNTFTPSES